MNDNSLPPPSRFLAEEALKIPVLVCGNLYFNECPDLIKRKQQLMTMYDMHLMSSTDLIGSCIEKLLVMENNLPGRSKCHSH